MASIQEILGKNIDSVKALKAEIRALQDSLVGLDTESQEYKDTTTKLTAAQDELNKVTRAGKADNDAAKDSIVGMRQEYKALYDQYKLLTEEQRNSDFGKNMAASLESLSNKINDTQKGVGSFKDNIGRYASSVEEAFSKMGVSVGTLKGPLDLVKKGGEGLNKTFKALAKNPWMLALTALIAILTKAAAAIKNNEQLSMRLQQALSVFKPVLDMVSNAFDFLAGILVKTVEGLSKVAEKVMSIIPGFKKAAESHKELAKATDDLAKKQRELNVANSQKQADIERLREEASATEDAEEKTRLLQEAKEKQAEVDQANIEIAQEELRILEEYAAKTANSAEENDKLAAAQKKVNDAIAQGERNQRMYNKQLDAANRSTRTAASSVKDYRDEAKKLYEQLIEDGKDEITKLTEKYEKEKKLLEKYHYDTTKLTEKYNDDLNKIESESAEKRKEIRLKGLQQMRSDLEDEWQLYRNLGEDFIATALETENLEKKVIPAVKKLDDIVTGVIKDIFGKKGEKEASLFENYVNENGFEALGDEYKEIKDLVDEINASFGLSIKTIKGLETTLENLNNRRKELLGEISLDAIAETTSEELVKRFEWAFEQIKELGIGEETKNIFKSTDWTFDFITEEMLKKEYESLEEQKKLFEQELEEFKGTQDQKLQILQEYYSVVEEMEERHRELSELNQQRTQEMLENLIARMDNISSSLGTVKSSYDTLIDSQVKAGKIDEKEARNKKKRLLNLEKIQTAFSIATIAADAASGMFSIWKGWATETGVINPEKAAAAGPAGVGLLAGLNAKSLVSAIAKSASLATTATAQIMAARNGMVASVNNFNAESGNAGADSVGVTPTVINSEPYSYMRQVQTAEEEDLLNRPVWVSVQDISSALDHQVVVTDESSF